MMWFHCSGDRQLSVRFPPEYMLEIYITWGGKVFPQFAKEPGGSRSACGVELGFTGFTCLIFPSPAGLPSPAHPCILSEPARPSDPSVLVAVTSTRPPASVQCHPRQHLTPSPDAPSIQGPKSSASPCLTTRWTGVRAGRSIIRSATPTLQW